VANVADIPLDGKTDAMGQEIKCFYGRKPPKYAVYRVDRRVMVHFADNGEEEASQRKKLACLAPLRGEIDGLVDGWRDGTSHRFLGVDNRTKLRSKAVRYDRRVADALVVALEGDIPTAQTILTRVRDDIVNERVAWARFEYLVAAFVSALVVMFVAWLLSSLYPVAGHADETEDRQTAIGAIILILMSAAAIVVHLAGVKAKRRDVGENDAGTENRSDTDPSGAKWDPATRMLLGLLLFLIVAIPVFAILIYPSFRYLPVHPDYALAIDLWQAAAAGAVGAFFSISLAIRGRTVLPDLQRTSNLMDAVLRVTIGFIAGAVVMGLIRAGIVDLRFGDVARDTEAVLPVLITGFVAGFSERLVPDLLDKADFKTTDPSAPAPTAVKSPAPGDGRERTGSADEAPATSPLVDEPDPVPEEAAEDACAVAIDLDDDEVTADSDLPAATGGVARPEGDSR